MKHLIVILGMVVLGCSGRVEGDILLAPGVPVVGAGGDLDGAGGAIEEPIGVGSTSGETGGTGGSQPLAGVGVGGTEPRGSTGGASEDGTGGTEDPIGVGGSESQGIGGDVGVGGSTETGGAIGSGGDLIGSGGVETGGAVGAGGAGSGGDLIGSGGVDTGAGGTPSCVPNDIQCGISDCGTAPDGCGGEIACGYCVPMSVTSSTGRVCDEGETIADESFCEYVDLSPSDKRMPGYDVECNVTHGEDYGEAWLGFGSGTSCITLTGTDVMCCEPSDICHAVAVTGCGEKLFNCSNPNRPECMQLVQNGRFKNEWCCD